MAIIGGILVGAVVNFMRKSVDAPAHYFHDGVYWEGVCDLEGAPSSMAMPEGTVTSGTDCVTIHPIDAIDEKCSESDNKENAIPPTMQDVQLGSNGATQSAA